MRRITLLLAFLLPSVLFCCAPDATPASPPPYPPPYPLPDTLTTEPLGSLTGKVLLQGRMNHQGARVTVGKLPPVTTLSDGSYGPIRSVPLGQHAIRATLPGYVSAAGVVTIDSSLQAYAMPAITLLAGDLNGDETVDLFDLVLLSTLFGNQEVGSLHSDLNADGAVGLADLVLVGNNLGETGPMSYE